MPRSHFTRRVEARDNPTASAMPPVPQQCIGATALSDCALPALHIVMATRLIIFCRRRGQCALPLLIDRLKYPRAVEQALTLVNLIGAVWPDRFCLSPPCCQRLSHDEQLLAQLASAAARGNTVRFHTIGCDYLADAPLAQLYAQLHIFGAAVADG